MAPMPESASTRTTQPIVTGGSIVAIKYAGGVMVAADTLCSYGSLARFDNVVRMTKVGLGGDTLLTAGGDYSDYQEMIKMVEKKTNQEFVIDDGATIAPSAMHHWLTRIMYQRRSKMDPLWNRCNRRPPHAAHPPPPAPRSPSP